MKNLRNILNNKNNLLLILLIFATILIILTSFLLTNKSVVNNNKAAIACTTQIINCPDGQTAVDTNTDPNSCPIYKCVVITPELTTTISPTACSNVVISCPAGTTRVDTNPNGCPIFTCTPDLTVKPTSCVGFMCGITKTPIPISGTASCLCESDNLCSPSCNFQTVKGTNYGKNGNGQISCARENGIGTSPSQSDKDNYCKTADGTPSTRTLGDADMDGQINNLDYIYYVRVVNGGQIPANINPDFNGDGVVSPSDRAIVVGSINLANGK